MARTTYKFPIIHGRRRASWTVESLKERKGQPKVEKSSVTFSRRAIDVKWLCHQHSVSNTSIKLPWQKMENSTKTSTNKDSSRNHKRDGALLD